MVLIEPENPESPLLSTEQILRVIDENASETALVFLSAVQFYSGQYFDMKRITVHAHSRGILIGWDCAHAVGNVDLHLHDWDVDFAAWCSYKYLNSGPGGMAGLFVHERHGFVENANGKVSFHPRLTGWWGHDKSTRFNMDNSMKQHLALFSPCSFAHRVPNQFYRRIRPPTWCSRIPAIESFSSGYERRHCRP